MKLRSIFVSVFFFIFNVNVIMCQSLKDEEIKYYRSLINHIGDTSFMACYCWIDVHTGTSIVPSHQSGVEYAISVERAIDSLFPECSTIAKNDSLFILNAKDMEEIKNLYETWFFLWSSGEYHISNQRKILDGTKYGWVDIGTK